MDQSEENKTEIKDRIINFLNDNKVKIYIFIFILATVLGSFIFIKTNNEKKNVLVAEKYVKAGINLASNKNDIAKSLYEEIILSKNEFYAILALNTIIEKDLVIDQKKILEYFVVLERSVATKETIDLIKLKKALYLIKILDIETGNELLKSLIDDNSNLKSIAKELIEE
tara:strand:- start:4324 stop:4833 length:510 start_codon:yes stop_codon:yes gene_type:complete